MLTKSPPAGKISNRITLLQVKAFVDPDQKLYSSSNLKLKRVLKQTFFVFIFLNFWKNKKKVYLYTKESKIEKQSILINI